MNICEALERTPEQTGAFLAVWEAPERTTHHFLTGAEIVRVQSYVPQALQSVRCLLAAERAGRDYGAREGTVNEQNPQAAAGGYRHLGFGLERRASLDEAGACICA